MNDFEKRIDEAFARLERMEEEVYDDSDFFFPCGYEEDMPQPHEERQKEKLADEVYELPF